jgi:hypothetical protein
MNRARPPSDSEPYCSKEDAHAPNERSHRTGLGPALLDVIARFEGDAGPSEADFLAQLHAAIAAIEMPADRLFARYHGRPSSLPNFTRGH